MACTVNKNSLMWCGLLVPSMAMRFRMCWITIMLVVMNFVIGSHANLCTNPSLPAINKVTFEHSTPKGGMAAGNYTKDPYALDFASCVISCCEQPSCNVVFMFDTVCYLIECNVSDPSGCDPKYRKDDKFQKTYVVLVREIADYTYSTTTTPSYDNEANQNGSQGKMNTLLSEIASKLKKHKMNNSSFESLNNVTANMRNISASDNVTASTVTDGVNAQPNVTLSPAASEAPDVVNSTTTSGEASTPSETSPKSPESTAETNEVNSVNRSPVDDMTPMFSDSLKNSSESHTTEMKPVESTTAGSDNVTATGPPKPEFKGSNFSTSSPVNTTGVSSAENSTTLVGTKTSVVENTTGDAGHTSVTETPTSATEAHSGVTKNSSGTTAPDVPPSTTPGTDETHTPSSTESPSSTVTSQGADTTKTTDAEKAADLLSSLKGLLNNDTYAGKSKLNHSADNITVAPPSSHRENHVSSGTSTTKVSPTVKPTTANLEALIKELTDLVNSHNTQSVNKKPKEPDHTQESPKSTTNAASSLPSRKKDISCIYGLKDECEPHEECTPKNSRTRSGLCHCVEGYTRDTASGWCLSDSRERTSGTTADQSSMLPTPEKKSGNTSGTPPPTTTTTKITPTSPPGSVTTVSSENKQSKTVNPGVMQLVVSAGKNQKIQLPKNEATLSAYVVPEAAEGEPYQYLWTLIAHPDGAETGTMQGKNTNKLKLSNVIAGLYTFEVEVTAPGKYGKSTVNVTVLPVTRINQSPVAVIKPPFQEIQLPNSAVLDGSESTDDDKIVKYNWEEVLGPLEEQKLENSDKPMLMLPKLAPGKYRFKLTVTDSDGATDSTVANVTALKEVDYPPQANAGSNIIISLPQNSAILYGNKSTDDHGIVGYEWIKKSDGKNELTADVKGVRSPNLQLNNLEVGDYTFTLKVTDTGGMTSTADVHVFVRPEQNQPPLANAGEDTDVILPKTSAILDGSKSTDDQQIVRYQWTQISGPGGLAIQDADKAVATVTNLKLGDYQFRLTVFDVEKVQAEDSVKIHVKENGNLAPTADAGGDKIVYLPRHTIFVDGSKSTDDKGITDWLWTRDDASLAAGDIANGSDHQPILQVTNIVAGRYVFILKVTDADGLNNIDTASIIVRQDKEIKNLVEVHVKADLKTFTEANKKSWANQLGLLLHKPSQSGDTQIEIQHIEQWNGDMVIYFYVYIAGRASREIWSGPSVVSILKEKLTKQADMLYYAVSFIDTVVCQNNCSGHGTCDPGTKRCLCDPFWMENFFKAHFLYREYNCDWSILYVIIVAFLIVVALGAFFWSIVCLIRRYRRMRPRKRHRYQLLEEFDDKNSMSMKPKGKMQNSSLMVSESDATSDEETIFVNSKKANGHLRKTNGFLKHTKKLKA
ncbi:dyslexia-associated protein KIAA0319-like protein isoform X2 [Lineus longissimus]|uniref:dyslexia-associated protein KIAA0319-like protein isoform X2 n=1 Tax=Lineus longissimus TaxID=88925 RepID=UPI00315D478C